MEEVRKKRVLIAKVGCDIHERGALTLLTALSGAGMEVIYTGRYQTPEAVAVAATSEDVDVIALSDHTGSLPIIAEQVIAELSKLEAGDIPIIAGGLLTPQDVEALESMGVKGNLGPGTPIEAIVDIINEITKR
ncbi:MAG: cobalamin-dependent protein [Actinobacteria bacterium]|nr:cobalamin-dependent protein [Actinomycetota bacterium]